MPVQVEDGAVTAAEQTKAGAAQQQQVYLVQAPPPEIAKLRVGTSCMCTTVLGATMPPATSARKWYGI